MNDNINNISNDKNDNEIKEDNKSYSRNEELYDDVQNLDDFYKKINEDINLNKQNSTESPLGDNKFKFSIDLPNADKQRLHEYLNDDLLKEIGESPITSFNIPKNNSLSSFKKRYTNGTISYSKKDLPKFNLANTLLDNLQLNRIRSDLNLNKVNSSTNLSNIGKESNNNFSSEFNLNINERDFSFSDKELFNINIIKRNLNNGSSNQLINNNFEEKKLNENLIHKIFSEENLQEGNNNNNNNNYDVLNEIYDNNMINEENLSSPILNNENSPNQNIFTFQENEIKKENSKENTKENTEKNTEKNIRLDLLLNGKDIPVFIPSKFRKKDNKEGNLNEINDNIFNNNNINEIENKIIQNEGYKNKFDTNKEKIQIINKGNGLSSKKENKQRKPFEVRSGDWVCLQCSNLNFAFRTKCNRCGLSKEKNIKNKKSEPNVDAPVKEPVINQTSNLYDRVPFIPLTVGVPNMFINNMQQNKIPINPDAYFSYCNSNKKNIIKTTNNKKENNP